MTPASPINSVFFMRSGLNVGWIVLCVGSIHISSNFLWTSALLNQAHRVLGDIHAYGATQGMGVKSDTALIVCVLDIARIIGCVPNPSAAAKARDFLQYIRVGNGKLISLLHADGRGLNIGWHFVHRCYVKMTALVSSRTA